MKAALRPLIPEILLSAYHLVLAYLGALIYRFPSRRLTVIAVTGTKGKSTVVELIAAILREDGKRVASASTIQFCIAGECEPNLYKMTMPGRFFLHRFLRKAADAGCTHAVIELTSEAAKQHRHKGVQLDALVFTNLQPEHLESHGGIERYAAAKLSFARALERSPKRPRTVVANADDEYGEKFLDAAVEKRIPFSLSDAEPYNSDERSIRFLYRGELFTVPLAGLFNIKNCLAALALCDAFGVPQEVSKRALEHVTRIAGRAERIEKSQPFAVVVDYAHTPDSLRALLETYTNKKIITVMGSTGGGRDKWKRPAMGAIAEEFSNTVILTNEDPYDENPQQIVKEIAAGFKNQKPRIVLDRRDAIAAALKEAEDGDTVLITGKGTDPYIMGPRGRREPWSDANVAREELEKLGYVNFK